MWFNSAELGEKYCRINIPGRPDIYVFPKDMANTYAVAAVRYGSCDSKFRIGGSLITVPDGIAHFLEHKMFTGEDGSDVFERFTSLGADANAYTTYDRTVYLFNCTDRFPEAYSTLLHMVTHPYFTDETVKKEQGIIAQEIGMYEDDPDDVCYQNLLNAMYKNHPVKINVCGTVGSIGRITPKMLYDCHRTFYNPSNMVTIVCGRVEPEAVIEMVCNEIPFSEPVRTERCRYDEPGEVAGERVYAEKQVSKPLFSIGVKDININEDKIQQLRKHLLLKIILRMIFASSGDLYNRLYCDGLLTSPFSYSHDFSDSFSHLIISGSSDRPDEVYKRVRDYIADMQKKGIDSAAFERCRRVVLSDIIARYDSTEDIANSLVSSAFAGVDIFLEGQIVSLLTPKDAESLFTDEKFFGGDRFALSVVAPIAAKTLEKERI
jgi:predicted Zn-dependent peptidase